MFLAVFSRSNISIWSSLSAVFGCLSFSASWSLTLSVWLKSESALPLFSSTAMRFHFIFGPIFSISITHFLLNFSATVPVTIISLSTTPLFLLSVSSISIHYVPFLAVLSLKITRSEHTTNPLVSHQYYLLIKYLAQLLKTYYLFQNLPCPSDRSAII